MFRNVFIATFVISLFYSHELAAHSEHDKARFVATVGKDAGKCDQVLRPCLTIAYAVQQANKGDKILVASGDYTISSSEELFYLKSALVPIYGGYNRFDHFQSQSPNTNITRLNNIPHDMAEPLRKQGFVVVADGKTLFNEGSEEAKALQNKLASYHMLNQQQTALTCNNGRAGGFACNNIDLLSHMPLSQFSSNPSAANDVWGHVDLNTGDEYALIGLRNGIAVVNVTDPENPQEVGTISGASSTWRDIKVYQYFDANINAWQAYAYGTIDNSTDYVTIINLNQLPHSVSLVEKNRVVTQAHNVYITNVDYSLNIALPNLTPSIQLIGSNRFGGAFHSYSLETPNTLTQLTESYFGSGYTHDGASINITDERKDSQCGTTTDSCTVFIDFNEKEMKLWNISNPSATSILGSAEYDDVAKNFQYVHSGWGTEDKQHIFLHDEFDEKDGGLNSTVRIFSIADLKNPIQVGQWTGPTRAIDHNGFVRGNRYYMSNYERGLTVLDITDPATPVEIGYFDTYTPSDNAGFNGAWGAYPFLPSGNILVSDIGSGLYVLKDNTHQSPQGQIGFASQAVSSSQGQTLSIDILRSNVTDTSNAVSVNYQLIPGSAQEDSDYTPISGTLTWPAGDTAVQTISIDIASDTSGTEFQEKFFVRLSQPSNGASLAKHSYLTVNLDGVVDTGSLAFSQTSQRVPENQTTAVINVSRSGTSNGDVSVNYQLIAGSATIGQDVEATSGTLNWADGDATDKAISITLINDDLTENDESFTIELTANNNSRLGNNTRYQVIIADDDANTPPVVSVLDDFEVNTDANVEVTASARDNENDPLTYQWMQTAGDSVTLENATQTQASFVAPSSAGEITLSFTATDSKGSTTTEHVIITVVAPPITTPVPTPTPAPVVTPDKKSSSGGSFSLFTLLLLCFTVRKRLISDL